MGKADYRVSVRGISNDTTPQGGAAQEDLSTARPGLTFIRDAQHRWGLPAAPLTSYRRLPPAAPAPAPAGDKQGEGGGLLGAGGLSCRGRGSDGRSSSRLRAVERISQSSSRWKQTHARLRGSPSPGGRGGPGPRPGPEGQKTRLAGAGRPSPGLLSVPISNTAAVATAVGCRRTHSSVRRLSCGPHVTGAQLTARARAHPPEVDTRPTE